MRYVLRQYLYLGCSGGSVDGSMLSWGVVGGSSRIRRLSSLSWEGCMWYISWERGLGSLSMMGASLGRWRVVEVLVCGVYTACPGLFVFACHGVVFEASYGALKALSGCQ